MLDIALGQVDALHKVLEELQDGESISKKVKSKDDGRLQQIDSLLPPEVPTRPWPTTTITTAY